MTDVLTGKVALVTGGSRGIGRAVALALADSGVDVAFTYRARRVEAEEVHRRIRDVGRRSAVIRADFSMPREVEQVVPAVEEELGPIGILVNNAGIARPQPLEEITERDWDELITVNLKSVFLLTQAVIPRMRAQRWGRIINLSSVAAQLGGVVGPHYAASKAGLLGLTHSYAALLAEEGSTVNAIAPALIVTDMVTSNLRANAGLIPVKRLGSVEEVAEIAVMLARNGYITGQTLNVNGGWYMS